MQSLSSYGNQALPLRSFWARTEVGRPFPACPTGKSGLKEVRGGTGAEDVPLGTAHQVSFTKSTQAE